MKTRITAITIMLSVIVLAASLAIAQPNRASLTNPAGKTVLIPENAVEVAPGIFSLGTAVANGEKVEGYAIVHYKEGFGSKSSNARAGPTACYSFLAKGAKWKTVEDYIVDPANTEGLDETFVRSNVAGDLSKWEDAADGTVDGIVTKNIIGNEVSGIVDGADTSSPDDKNELYFGEISGTDTIGVTIVWGIFSGPTFQRKLVEWDMILDQTDFNWSGSGEAGKMDLENILTHELGHVVGMGDLYTSGCSGQTMYGYASTGETNKRTLESGDITGVNKLYA